ncbi:MAG: hypothetical protein Q7U54_02475, partial [Bacteroidales bacterium]|nr:hypothetical protein [Bacteroidales bacterium]
MGIFIHHTIYRVILTLVSVLVFWGEGLKGQTPILSVNPTILSGFFYTENAGPSSSNSYSLSGSDLTPVSGDITITCLSYYEVSIDNLIFGSTAIIPYLSGGIPDIPVYVRLKAGLIPGNYDGELIVNAGGGATDVSVSCSGTVTCALPAAPIGIAADPATICSGLSSILSVTDPGAGYTTDWYTVSCGGTAVAGGTGINSVSVSPATTTVYYAQTRNTTTGCVSACTNVAVTVNSLSAIPAGISASPATICSGLSSILSVTDPGAGYTTDWFTTSCGGTPVAGGTGINSVSVSPATTTTYYAQTRNTTTGCVSACMNVTVTVNSLSAIPAGISASPATICSGLSSILSVTDPGAGYTTDWFTTSCGGTPVAGGTGINSLSVSPATTTVYYAQT